MNKDSNGSKGMSPTEVAMEAFCQQFKRPLVYTPTDCIWVDGKPLKGKDMYTTSLNDQKNNIGFIVLAYQGKFRTIIDATGQLQEAGKIGKALAESLGLQKEEPHGEV